MSEASGSASKAADLLGTRIRVPGTDSVNWLLACPPPLLDFTFDQLRTLVVVQEAGSANGAAQLLGREQSSVQKQIDTLNRGFQRMCGELLVIKQGRGQPFLFTPTGTAVASQARVLLAEWRARVDDARHRIGKTVTLGTTEFTLRFVGQAWQRVAEEFAARETELNMIHVRTKDSFATIDDIYYGLALMRSEMAYGCMLTSASIAQAAVEGRLPGGPGLRLVGLGSDFSPMMELVSGTFARHGERRAFAPAHPLNLLWQAFADEVASGNPYQI